MYVLIHCWLIACGRVERLSQCNRLDRGADIYDVKPQSIQQQNSVPNAYGRVRRLEHWNRLDRCSRYIRCIRQQIQQL